MEINREMEDRVDPAAVIGFARSMLKNIRNMVAVPSRVLFFVDTVETMLRWAAEGIEAERRTAGGK